MLKGDEDHKEFFTKANRFMKRFIFEDPVIMRRLASSKAFCEINLKEIDKMESADEKL